MYKKLLVFSILCLSFGSCEFGEQKAAQNKPNTNTDTTTQGNQDESSQDMPREETDLCRGSHLAILADGRTVISKVFIGQRNKTLSWDIHTLKLRKFLPYLADDFSVSGNKVFYLNRLKNNVYQVVKSTRFGISYNERFTFKSKLKPFVSFSKDSRHLISVSASGDAKYLRDVKIYSLYSKRYVSAFSYDNILHIEMISLRRIILTVLVDGEVQILETDINGKITNRINMGEVTFKKVVGITYKNIFIRVDDELIKYDLRSGEELLRLTGVEEVRINKSGTRALLFFTKNQVLSIINLKTGYVVNEIKMPAMVNLNTCTPSSFGGDFTCLGLSQKSPVYLWSPDTFTFSKHCYEL